MQLPSPVCCQALARDTSERSTPQHHPDPILAYIENGCDQPPVVRPQRSDFWRRGREAVGTKSAWWVMQGEPNVDFGLPEWLSYDNS